MRDATSKHTQTEWVLCSEDLQDTVITYILQLNDILIERNQRCIFQAWLMEETTPEKSKIIFYDCIFEFQLLLVNYSLHLYIHNLEQN